MTRPNKEIARELVEDIYDRNMDSRMQEDVDAIAAALDTRDKEWGELVAGMKEALEFYANELLPIETIRDRARAALSALKEQP